MRSAWLTIAMTTVALACGNASEFVGPLPPGLWGGDGVSLVVGTDSARVEFTCAAGTLEIPITVGADGQFQTAGTYLPQAGPVLRESPWPAVYSGTLSSARTMTMTSPSGMTRVIALSVTISPAPDPPFTIGPFELLEGHDETVAVCR